MVLCDSRCAAPVVDARVLAGHVAHRAVTRLPRGCEFEAGAATNCDGSRLRGKPPGCTGAAMRGVSCVCVPWRGAALHATNSGVASVAGGGLYPVHSSSSVSAPPRAATAGRIHTRTSVCARVCRPSFACADM
jgi:hypothetical protein